MGRPTRLNSARDSDPSFSRPLRNQLLFRRCQFTCVWNSDFNRWVSSTCPWMLDLHSRRPGRAANTSRSLCLQRAGRKHAPNLPLLRGAQSRRATITAQATQDRKTLIRKEARKEGRKGGSRQAKPQQRASPQRTSALGFRPAPKDGLTVGEAPRRHSVTEDTYLLRGLVPSCCSSSF